MVVTERDVLTEVKKSSVAECQLKAPDILHLGLAWCCAGVLTSAVSLLATEPQGSISLAVCSCCL